VLYALLLYVLHMLPQDDGEDDKEPAATEGEHLVHLLPNLCSDGLAAAWSLHVPPQDEGEDDEEPAATEGEEDEEGFVVGDGYLSDDEGMRDADEDAAAGALGF
jgi:hypothetical protein